ncbi:MAG: aldo/keto reductase [Bacteroidetes bacterium]|nr:MAG: aldo/keto reductase [Bacteroidota bacterium]
MPLKYSKIIAGTMAWGCWGKQLNTEEMIHLIHYCLENDITTFDHADIYGDYTTEAEFGNALAKSDINRSEIQIITKCGIQYLGSSRANKIKHYNYFKDYIIWSVEESLKNLKTDYLDVLLLHRPSPLMHPYEVMEAITKLAQEGKIKDFGVSNFTPSQGDLISSEVPITINQIEFSVTNHSAMYDGVLDQIIIKNIVPMAWSPLGNVFKQATEQTNRIHIQLEDLKTKYNATKDELLLAWILKHPAQIHPVIGTTNNTRITNANKALTIDLELEDWFLVLKASQGHKVP